MGCGGSKQTEVEGKGSPKKGQGSPKKGQNSAKSKGKGKENPVSNLKFCSVRLLFYIEQGFVLSVYVCLSVLSLIHISEPTRRA